MPSETAPVYNILVVDDNPPFRHLVTAWLRDQQYGVAEAEDGNQALAELQQRPADLVLLDLQMEPMGGLNFMEELQTTAYRTLPVVLITADPSTDILLRASKMGFAGVMKKPVSRDNLLKMIAQQLARRMPVAKTASATDLTAL